MPGQHKFCTTALPDKRDSGQPGSSNQERSRFRRSVYRLGPEKGGRRAALIEHTYRHWELTRLQVSMRGTHREAACALGDNRAVESSDPSPQFIVVVN